TWLLKSTVVGTFFVAILVFMMTLDYWYVMNQINENHDLKLANRRLRQQVQIFKNQMVNIEKTLDRVESFSNRLKVITNIEDGDGLVQRLNEDLPQANQNVALLNSNSTPIEDESVAFSEPTV